MSSLNFSAESFNQSDSYSPIPAGTYTATVFEVKHVEVKNGANAGKPQYSVQFRIAEGQQENRRVFTYIPLYAGKSEWKALAFFKALGYEPKPGEPFTIPTPADLAGKPIAVKVTLVPDQNGGEENNVAGFKSGVSSQAVDNLAAILGVTTEPTASKDLF
jgi:hypothetical protein